MPPKAKRTKKAHPIVVTVSDTSLPKIHELANRLAAKGMKVNQVMPITGVITGSYGGASKSALKKVQGVTSVEDELAADLPPPDAPQ